MSASEWAGWWGAATGTVSVGLLAVRFKWDRGSEGRARRLELRNELRELASEARRELSAARTSASLGSPVGPVGEFVEKSNGDNGIRSIVDRVVGVNRNPNVLLKPANKKLYEVGHEAGQGIFKIRSEWKSVESAEKYPDTYTDHQRAIKTAEFLRIIDPAVDACRKLVALLDETGP